MIQLQQTLDKLTAELACIDEPQNLKSRISIFLAEDTYNFIMTGNLRASQREVENLISDEPKTLAGCPYAVTSSIDSGCALIMAGWKPVVLFHFPTGGAVRIRPEVDEDQIEALQAIFARNQADVVQVRNPVIKVLKSRQLAPVLTPPISDNPESEKVDYWAVDLRYLARTGLLEQTPIGRDGGAFYALTPLCRHAFKEFEYLRFR
ncbi:hypothetical protein [Henriciella sp.]|uniref:hypothetical protein n=1 Tax=Henriciella sp. TaxID=1968823 RepID=UPI00260A899E|nr:hypothetical protein [Henriciella sp.]